jgi:hypothetical protein
MTEALWMVLAAAGFLVFVGLLLLHLQMQYRWDRARIERDLAKRNHRLTSLLVMPYDSGSYAAHMNLPERIYKVRYVDQAGTEHCACCRTGLLTGVSWSEEEPSGSAVRLAPEDTPEEAARKIVAAQELRNHRSDT